MFIHVFNLPWYSLCFHASFPLLLFLLILLTHRYFKNECERFQAKVDAAEERARPPARSGGAGAGAGGGVGDESDAEQRLFEQTLTLEVKERKIALLVKEKTEVEGLLRVAERRVARLGTNVTALLVVVGFRMKSSVSSVTEAARGPVRLENVCVVCTRMF